MSLKALQSKTPAARQSPPRQIDTGKNGDGRGRALSANVSHGGKDRSESSVELFYAWLDAKKSAGIRLAVMDMWKPFRLATRAHAPKAAILFDKFRIMRHLGEALDTVPWRSPELTGVCSRE
jgi:hypothetical protein